MATWWYTGATVGLLLAALITAVIGIQQLKLSRESSDRERELRERQMDVAILPVLTTTDLTLQIDESTPLPTSVIGFGISNIGFGPARQVVVSVWALQDKGESIERSAMRRNEAFRGVLLPDDQVAASVIRAGLTERFAVVLKGRRVAHFSPVLVRIEGIDLLGRPLAEVPAFDLRLVFEAPRQ